MTLSVLVIDLRKFDGTKEHYDKLYKEGKRIVINNVLDVSKAMDNLRRQYPAGDYALEEVTTV